MGGDSGPDGWGHKGQDAGTSLRENVRRGVPFEDGDDDEDRREGLTDDMGRTDKAIEALSGQLELLYDRLAPILGQERPTEDNDNMKAQAEQYPPLREREKRQARQLEHLRWKTQAIVERIEL